MESPCGCPINDREIKRRVNGVLLPTIWIFCRCEKHKKTWTERYEYDFRIPLNGKANEDQEEK